MIRRLGLRNWRSYKNLDLELGPGTTFVVAPNGVGKTSLVYGLAWGVFGESSSVNPKECIRAGSESAEVCVEFDLADERLLSIRRTARRRGASAVVYEMDGTRLQEGQAVAEMERVLGIELGVASRLSMMLGGGHFAASDALNLESHLHHAFGVTPPSKRGDECRGRCQRGGKGADVASVDNKGAHGGPCGDGERDCGTRNGAS